MAISRSATLNGAHFNKPPINRIWATWQEHLNCVLFLSDVTFSLFSALSRSRCKRPHSVIQRPKIAQAFTFTAAVRLKEVVLRRFRIFTRSLHNALASAPPGCVFNHQRHTLANTVCQNTNTLLPRNSQHAETLKNILTHLHFSFSCFGNVLRLPLTIVVFLVLMFVLALQWWG